MEYLGSGYAGFQVQPGKKTVQEALQTAIGRVTGETVRVIGSGRTDAGAHAVGQVIAFATDSRLGPRILKRAINAHLPDDIVVTSAEEAPLDFHPRFDAKRRIYRYLVWNREASSPFWRGRAMHVRPHLDAHRMAEAAQVFVGEHDFGAFVACGAPGPRQRMMFRAQCWREGQLVVIELEATGFLQQMARTMAGTLVEVGLGRLSPNDVRAIVDSRDRRRAGATAPACGLYLVQVEYDERRHTTPQLSGASTALASGGFEET